AGNAAPTVTRTVTVSDTIAPVITLTGSASVIHELGTTYTDAGATANGGETVTTSGTVNVNTAGTYTLTYSATDAAGNAATTVTRTVTVSDTIAPVITLAGEAVVTIEVGSNYEEQGATAKDSADGDLTSQIKVTGEVDVNKAGEYQLKYNVVDASGNKSLELTRRVIVKTTSKESIRIEKYNHTPFWFDFSSKKGRNYIIEFSNNLRSWEEIKIINGTGEMIRFEDERDQVFPQIYYRVKVAN
ncbi:MAG: DUF5011 domain-containing protein, partial [Verrucomicrobiota bacterium]|nr:DUF5011 domain-containing protein [Verrucomicrobiota bacterium]